MCRNLTTLFALFFLLAKLSAQNAADSCAQAINISAFFTNSPTPVFTPLYNNLGATGETNLNGVGCFLETAFGDTIVVDNSVWFQFLGDGESYQIQTAPCNADTNYIDGGDTQMAIYEGDCNNLTPVDCNEDLSQPIFGDFRAGLSIETVANSTYLMLIDGFGGADGAFCLEIIRTGVNDDCSAAADISAFFGQPIDSATLTTIFDNTNATTSASDPTEGFDCFNEPDGASLENTTFYKFVGDGNFYQITTAPCPGLTDYNDDTQLAIYAGAPCQFSQPIDCNDDFYGNAGVDLRAGVTLLTVPGQEYQMMIDGWNGKTGDFCIEITQIVPLNCSDAQFGAANASSVNLCAGSAVTIGLDSATTIVPNIGTVSGFSWLISSQPFPAGYTGAPEDFAGYLTFTGISSNYYDFLVVNDTASPINAGTYFITPFLVAGVDTNACNLYGAPIALNVFGILPPLVVGSVVTPETNPGDNGSIALTTAGGSGNYTYLWSNNSTNPTQINLAAGDYLVTVSDQSGCIAPLFLTINVSDSTFVNLPSNDECNAAINITSYFGQPIGTISVTPAYDITNATTSASDPSDGYECFLEGNGPTLNNTTFFSFVGDGNYYQITTAPCAGAENYNTDTQMAVYEGSGCQYGQTVACNDDFFANGDPDYRSGTDFLTVPGQEYILMIDGWDGSPGDFCFEIVQLTPIGCAQAQLGAPEVDEVNICYDGSIVFILDGNSTVVPNIGPTAGFAWLISLEPFPPGYDVAPTNFSGYAGSTGLSDEYYDFPIDNDPQDPIEAGVYYITPYLVSGATQVSGDPIDTEGGCYFYGATITLNAFEELEPLTATTTVTPETTPLNNGSIALEVLGGSDIYSFEWSNGSTTQNISNLTSGNYTVTVSDISGCADPIILTLTVNEIIGTQNPANVVSLQTMPNPTNGPLNFSIQLADNQLVVVKLFNAIGQIIERRAFAEGDKIDGSFDLSELSAGVYFLKFEIGNQTTQRRIVLVK